VVTVHNAGPDAAQNAYVSDSVPAQTTLSGGQPPPDWTCSISSTITCIKPSFASGDTAVFTFTVHVSSSASGTISNTATVSSDTTDRTPSNNSATALTTVGSPTAVTLRSFTATRSGRGVTLRWRTATEAKLLGFNVYRTAGEGRLRLNQRLIPVRSGAAGASYRYVDRRVPIRATKLVYRLQAVAQDGSCTFFGSA
jgi:hypothetical protein